MSQLSRSDIAILRQLQSDASQSVAEIAEKVNLSPSSCWRRMHQMQESGIIKQQVALLDPEILGLDVVVFVMLSLVSQNGNALSDFENAVAMFPEVVECYTMTGQNDYMLKVVTRSMRHYESFVRQHLAQLDNIRDMHSHVAITRIKDSVALPLETQL